ncbi:TPA: hypothetical protein HA249_03600 [Candidatus Woesearchaeota archaeon]|nr:hypothetical protein [Candidatus Woesearchaeota archaeon]HII88516.1 hypothetical protein [Candidatus Woesearchaeota archaeon]
MVWKIRKVIKTMPKLKDPILIEGLPGIGNVGKVAVDFMIDELGAVKIMEFSSYSLPHSVFVNEENLVELPRIELYYKKASDFNKLSKKNKKLLLPNRDFLFLSGDIQPTDEEASYDFSNTLLDVFNQFKGKELITIGGIGLSEIPEKPKVFCTGTAKHTVKNFIHDTPASSKLYGVVGPIVGVTGLLVGLAEKRKMHAVCLLAETYAHPLYLGIKGSQEVLKILNKKLSLNLDLKSLNTEIKEVEQEIMKRTEQLQNVTKKESAGQVSYIG